MSLFFRTSWQLTLGHLCMNLLCLWCVGKCLLWFMKNGCFSLRTKLPHVKSCCCTAPVQMKTPPLTNGLFIKSEIFCLFVDLNSAWDSSKSKQDNFPYGATTFLLFFTKRDISLRYKLDTILFHFE